VLAHRGFWQTRGSAQNSIASFAHAARLNLYGSEFDVHMTIDSVLVVVHDGKVNNIFIEDSPYSAIQDIVLSNGEKIPTLREFLEAASANMGTTKLIFELKVDKNDPEWSRKCARRSIDLIREKKLQLQTEFITFNLVAAKELIRLAPEVDVYYLNGELSPKELKALGFAGLDYHYDVMLKNPHWFKEAKALGLGINVWTVNDPELIRQMANYGADFITTDIPNDALKIISAIKW
jgi:glycerophosphoryl diester phosphodiesterase